MVPNSEGLRDKRARLKLMLKNLKAFSLIELMIVVAIIGILATIAIPSYSVYVKKAKVIDAINLLHSVTPELQTSLTSTGSCPATLHMAGINLPGDSVGGASVRTDFRGLSIVQAVWYNRCVSRNTFGYCTCQVAAQLTSDFGGGAISIMLSPQPDGSIKQACGLYQMGGWDYGDGSIVRYLPASCNATNLSSFS